MRRILPIALMLVAGCADGSTSRLAAGSRVVVVADDGRRQWAEPVGDVVRLNADHGATGVTVGDGEGPGDGSRRVTVRFEDDPPWTGKVLRRTLRPVR